MNKNRLIQLCILIFFWNGIQAQDTSRISLVFAGDIMGHDSQIESAKKMGDGEYDYESVFKHIRPYIASADIAIGNLEVTLAGPPYAGYPAFSSPDELAIELGETGFDILVNANNHAIDLRKKGLERTIDVLESLGIIQTGVFKDSTQRKLKYPLIVEKNNIRLALLNYTYGTNGIKVSVPNIVNYIDTSLIKNDLVKAATANPDFTIVMMHWGLEYERKENKEQQLMAEFLFKNGADAIIGSHPHVVQPIKEFIDEKLVVYSMGNMISNQRKRYTNGGILIDLVIEKAEAAKITEYNFLPIYVHKAVLEKGTAFSLVPAAVDSSFYDSLRLTSDDVANMHLFLNDTRENLVGSNESDWKEAMGIKEKAGFR